eukprot:5945829-Ditylum_brightwellii.AAC.1
MALPFPLSVILWTAAAGGEMPPFSSPTAWAEDKIKTWTKLNDVIVVITKRFPLFQNRPNGLFRERGNLRQAIFIFQNK